jgi:hypothetical protein
MNGSHELNPCPALNPEKEVNLWMKEMTLRGTVMCCLLDTRSVRNLKWIFHYGREKIQDHDLDAHVGFQHQ